MKGRFHVLSRIGVGLILLVALQFWVRVLLDVPFPEKRMFAALPSVKPLFEAGRNYQDQISEYEARFLEVKKMLPEHSVVGYLSSPSFPLGEAKVHFGLTRYTLAPVIVNWSTHHSLLIGNFPLSEVQMNDEIEHFTIVKDFGKGVMLLKKKDTL
jgi:hypothetical protein